MCIYFFHVLEQTISYITIETGDKATVFVTDNLVAVESTDTHRTVARELDSLIAHGRKIQAKIIGEVLADFITPSKSQFPATGLHTTNVHPNLAVPVVITQSQDVLLRIEHIYGLLLEVFECHAQT